MKKIKDMAEDELIRLVAQVARRTTDPIESMMREIVRRFERIEKRITEEIKYPNEQKEYILAGINELNRDIDKFLKQVKKDK